MIELFTHIVEILALIWRSMALGLALVIGAAWAGWLMARFGSLPPVRLIAWWVAHVIVPLVRSRSWLRRTVVIFVNNTSVLAAVLALGFHPVVSILAVMGLGISLGIGLRVLSENADVLSSSPEDPGTTARITTLIGVALNLLEPPAIVLVIGLSLGRTAASLPAGVAWKIFAVWAVPLLVIAAAGEALWLGSGPTNGDHLEAASLDAAPEP